MSGHSIDPESLPYLPAELEAKPPIEASTFFAVDLRVGRVVSAEVFPEARKPSYKLAVDFGPIIGQLNTSAQVTNYAIADLVGSLVVGALNLGTRRIAGFESEFLVLGGLHPDGTVELLRPDHEVQPGAPVA